MCNIWIIEENRAMQTILKRMVEENNSHVVLGVSEGAKSAIVEIAIAIPDIVLLSDSVIDMHLIDTVIEIREISDDIGIIILSSIFSREMMVPSANAGADDFVAKPVNKLKLLKTIEDVRNNKK